jgi:hypothetical protein
MDNRPTAPLQGEGSDALVDMVRQARDIKSEGDCPWLASDPQLLAAAAKDRMTERTPELAAQELVDPESKRVQDEMTQLLRRAG